MDKQTAQFTGAIIGTSVFVIGTIAAVKISDKIKARKLNKSKTTVALIENV